MKLTPVALLTLFMLATPACWAEESAIKRAAMLPVRGAAAAVAVMVGTPIAIGRLSAKQYREHMNGDSDIARPAGIFVAIPMGFGEGFCQGIFYGPRNAITNFDKPLSKDAMSLGDDIINKQ